MLTEMCKPIRPTVFGFYVAIARDNLRKKGRNRNLKHQIDRQYLEKLWYAQQGRCALTGMYMILPNMLSPSHCRRRFMFFPTDNSLLYASLDRIDSSKGYIPGNVHFVCRGINYLKSTVSSEQVTQFLDMICKDRNNIPKFQFPTHLPTD